MSRNFGTTDGFSLSTTSIPVTNYPMTFALWWQGTTATANSAHLSLMSIGDSAAAVDYMSLCLSFDGTPDTNDTVDFQVRKPSLGVGPRAVVYPNADGNFAYTGVWHHFAGYVTATNDMAVFWKGTVKGTASGALNFLSPVNVLRIGARPASWAPFPARGVIAHPAIWNAALDDAEILMLANGLSPLRVRSTSLVFYAPYLGRNSPEIEIMGARNLTVANATSNSLEPILQWPNGSP